MTAQLVERFVDDFGFNLVACGLQKPQSIRIRDKSVFATHAYTQTKRTVRAGRGSEKRRSGFRRILSPTHLVDSKGGRDDIVRVGGQEFDQPLR